MPPEAEAPVVEEPQVNEFDLFSEPGEDDTSEPETPPSPEPVETPPEVKPEEPVKPAEKPPEEPPAEPPAPPAAPVEEPKPEVKPPEPIAPEPKPPAPEPPAPERPAVPPSKPLTAEDIQARRKSTVEAIAKDYHVEFSDEEIATLQTEPEKVLPTKLRQLAAEVTVNAYEAVMQTAMAQLPRMVAGHVQGLQTVQTSSDQFFGKWPQLNKPEYHDTIRRTTLLYHQLNPKATLENAIESVGLQVSHLLKIPMEKAAPPAAPPAKPFVPAAPGGASPGPPKPSATNYFEELSREFERVD